MLVAVGVLVCAPVVADLLVLDAVGRLLAVAEGVGDAVEAVEVAVADSVFVADLLIEAALEADLEQPARPQPATTTSEVAITTGRFSTPPTVTAEDARSLAIMVNRVVYQGEPGANSHLVAQRVYPEAQAMAAPTFEDCFDAMKDASVDLAVIPIENSLAGRVADIHHLLPESGLHIVGEYFLPIRFQLMALPGTQIGDLTKVLSHVHALGQCRRLIRELGLKPFDVGDTAGAARQVAQAGDRTQAALAPEAAAQLYGLEILRRNVEDEQHNTTRFVMLAREPAHTPVNPAITTFVFRVRNIPAALYKGLGGFATNGVNMTKLESYQLDGTFVSTQFYADVEGHPDDRALALALEELAFFTTDLRILGVYPRSPYRDRLRAVPADQASVPD